MKRALSVSLPLLLLPLLLASCRSTPVQSPEEYDLSGSISGHWDSSPRLRLAIVGTGIPKILTNRSDLKQNVVVRGTAWAYGLNLDLPTLQNVAGVYQVVAFDDRNNDAKYEVGEPVARNRKFLIYSPADAETPAVTIPAEFPWAAGEEAIPALNVKKGWNVYDRSQPLSSSNPYAVAKITGYDLVR